MKTNSKVHYIITAGIIASLYVALTLLIYPLSYGPVQLRFSEALTVLAGLIPAAIPGLFVGCLISNIFGGGGLPDIIMGSLTTLLAAYFSYTLRNKLWLVPLPPVILNAFIVGTYLFYVVGVDGKPIWFSILSVGAGEIAACYVIGLPLLLLLKKMKNNNKINF